MSRWLGYVQGVMVVYGWLTVQEERENTRPLFHKDMMIWDGSNHASIKASLNNIEFHIVDMQDFNNRLLISIIV